MERGGLYPRGAYRARGAGAPSSRRSAPQRGHSPACVVRRSLNCCRQTPPALSGEASPVTTSPYPRTPVKPQLLLTNLASASGSASQTRAHDKRNLDTENPRRPVANYSTAGVSRTLPCGCVLNSSICSGSLGSPSGAPSRYLLCFTSAEESPGTCSFHKLLPMECLLHQTPCSSGTYRPLYLPIAFPTLASEQILHSSSGRPLFQP